MFTPKAAIAYLVSSQLIHFLFSSTFFHFSFFLFSSFISLLFLSSFFVYFPASCLSSSRFYFRLSLRSFIRFTFLFSFFPFPLFILNLSRTCFNFSVTFSYLFQFLWDLIYFAFYFVILFCSSEDNENIAFLSNFRLIYCWYSFPRSKAYQRVYITSSVHTLEICEMRL